jgi:ubiquinone/menaquinone biosynthesis C-methylase UbiE
MGKRVCPWWLGYFLASPVRRWFTQDPNEIVAPYVRPGSTVLEPGPGMGYFTLDLARLVGQSGRVIAVDVQPKMIAGLKKRLAKQQLLDRVEARTASENSLELEELATSVDFTLAFAVVHEMPDDQKFFDEVSAASKPGARLLLAEPEGHVKAEAFSAELEHAAQAGFRVVERPKIRRCEAALLQKQ